VFHIDHAPFVSVSTKTVVTGHRISTGGERFTLV
jgi:hypothetical protein